MAVSVVNGYVCFSSCDVAQAKQNKDPNVPPGAAHERLKSSALAGQPATILDGALKNLASAVSAPRGSDNQTRAVDRLA